METNEYKADLMNEEWLQNVYSNFQEHLSKKEYRECKVILRDVKDVSEGSAKVMEDELEDAEKEEVDNGD